LKGRQLVCGQKKIFVGEGRVEITSWKRGGGEGEGGEGRGDKTRGQKKKAHRGGEGQKTYPSI